MARRSYLAFMLNLVTALTVVAQPRSLRNGQEGDLIESATPINAKPRHVPSGSGTNADADAVRAAAQPKAEPAATGSRCVVCEQPCGASDAEVTYLGRRVALHTGLCCYDDFANHPSVYFAAMQARGAFLGEPPETTPPMRWGWFAFGSYVLIGLVFGAWCGYVAVGRGLMPVPWFFAGLAVNVVALLFLITRSRADLSALPAGVPAGLRKVPRTRSPSSCPQCRRPQHPSAAKCSGCGASLEPRVAAETSLI